MNQANTQNIFSRSCQRLILALTACFIMAGASQVAAQVTNTESFDGTTFPPTGWTRTGTYGTSTYLFRVTSGSNPTQSPHSGAGEVEYNSYSILSGVGNLITPVFDLSGIGTNTATVSLWFYRDVSNYNTSSYSAEGVNVYVNTTAALGGTQLGFVPRQGATAASGTYLATGSTTTTTTSGWYQYTFNIPSTYTSSSNYIVFSFNSQDGNNCFMDDVTWISYPPLCTGTPSPGNTLASSNPACANTPLVLSLQNATTGSGVTYQWQTSTNGTTYTNVTGATSSTYTVTQTAATYYRAQVTCANTSSTGTSNPVFVTQNPVSACYCIPVATSNSYYISSFVTTGGSTNASNSSGAGITSTGYSNYTATPGQAITAITGSTVSFSTAFTGGTFGAKIYVDWNQNGSFTDAGEQVFATTGYVSSATGSFTVPTTATGGATRLRVINDYYNGTASSAPCGFSATGPYGEAEDYTFNVIVPTPCAGTPVPGVATAFSPLAVTGFNADVIANSVGSATTSTTADVDGAGYFFLDSTYQYTSTSTIPTYALPASGVINSAATSGLSFKLQSAIGNNSLRIAPTGTSGTLTLTNPVAATNLYLLATSGSGAATADVTVTFTNTTTQTFSGLTFPDWYNGTPFAAQGIGRVNATNTQDGTSTNPRLYQLALPISAANSSLTIASITVTRTNATGYIQVMAVSASTATPAAFCAGGTKVLNATNTLSASTGITYQWQESSSASGPFTDVTTGTGGTTLSYTTPALTTTRYYVLKATCTNSTLSGLSNQVAVTVNPSPTVSVTSLPASAAICGGSGSVSLLASGTGTSYNWFPAIGLSATNIANPVATPASTTTYTVTATSSNGCTSTASKTVGVFPTLSTLTVRASNNNFCAGGATTLSAVDTNFGSATLPAGYTNGTVGYPTTDEDFGNITFGTLNNTTACGSLTGTIGTATGTAGSYSDFTAFTPARFNAGTSYPISLSSITCGTSNYSNAIAVYIDYNQNGSFTDAGETVYLSTSTTSGAHTETGTVIIPATAKPGTTRLRVIVNESSIPSGPQMSPSYGEIEDYAVRIIKPGTVPAASGYTWSPTTFLTSATGSPASATNVTASTTYTVTGIDTNGCSATGTVAVTVLPVPAVTFTSTNPSYCAGGSTTITASGASTYAWSPGTGLNTTTGATVTANPTVTTTYTVTATGTNSCVSTATHTVTVNQLPTILVTPAASLAICAGSGITLTASGASTYTWTPSGSLSAGTGATVTASPAATTTYTVTGTDGNGCVNTATKQVTVNPLPTVAITPTAAIAFCIGSSATLTASGANTYTWTPSATLSSGTGAMVTATPTTTTAYTVTGTDGNGCMNTATKTVTVNQRPAVTITPSTAAAVCTGSGIALTANGAASYTWTPSATLSSGTGATVTASPSANTTYTVTGTDSNGCTNTATKLVTVNPLPTVAITPVAAITFCAGGSVNLTASGAVNYSWTPASGLSATAGTTVTAAPTTTTTYTVTGTDANGCVNTATKLITVNPLPAVSISPSTPIVFCGTAGTASLTASGANTYTWSPTSGLSPTTGATVTASPAATTTYTVTGTDGNGCQNTAQKTIVINPLPTIIISPSTAPTICSGSSTTLTASGTSATYSWSPAGSLSPGTGATVTASPLTTTTYTVTATDSNGCMNTATRTVNVNLSPTVSISPAAASAFCIGGNVVLTASGASTYAWTPVTGLSSGIGATVTATPTTTTTYTVTGTATNGCTGTATKTVTIYQLPLIVVSPTTPAAICRGFSVGLSASGASTYTWTPAGSLNTGTGPSVTATPAVTTTYTVTGTDINGCVGSATKTVTVNNLPTVAISPAGTTTICRNSTVSLTATGASTYVWTPVAGLSSGTGAAVTATPAATTTYSVTGTDANGCTGTDSKQIIVNQLPTISISPATAVTICSGSGVTLTASGAATYTWTPSGTLSAPNGATVTATPPATTTYTVTGTDINGCSNTAARTVFVNGLPNVTITTTAPTTICPGTSVLLTAGGAATYVWTPAATLSAPTGTTVNATPPVTTTYTVTGTAANGCVNTATKTLTVYPKPVADFTPSGYLKICQFDSVTFNATPGYMNYSWRIYGTPIQTATTNALTTGTGGFYTLQVTDSNGCMSATATSTIVTVVPRPVPVLYHNRTLLYVDSAYNSYAWYRNGVAIAGANSASYTATQTGIYNVVVTTDSSNCTGSSLPFNITNLSVLNPALGDAVKLYPNPATDILRIEAPVPVSVTVSSMDGKQVFSGADVRQINISEWPDGVYSVIIRDKAGAYLKAEKVTKVSR